MFIQFSSNLFIYASFFPIQKFMRLFKCECIHLDSIIHAFIHFFCNILCKCFYASTPHLLIYQPFTQTKYLTHSILTKSSTQKFIHPLIHLSIERVIPKFNSPSINPILISATKPHTHLTTQPPTDQAPSSPNDSSHKKYIQDQDQSLWGTKKDQVPEGFSSFLLLFQSHRQILCCSRIDSILLSLVVTCVEEWRKCL